MSGPSDDAVGRDVRTGRCGGGGGEGRGSACARILETRRTASNDSSVGSIKVQSAGERRAVYRVVSHPETKFAAIAAVNEEGEECVVTPEGRARLRVADALGRGGGGTGNADRKSGDHGAGVL